MSHKPRPKTKLPKGLAVRKSVAKMRNGRLSYSCIGDDCTLDSFGFPHLNAKSVVIGKSYAEPLGCDLVEELLLSRDYIID